jgi:hypothetical protein
MGEKECYARLYGASRMVQVVQLPPHRISGEQLRRMFERRLDTREREAA